MRIIQGGYGQQNGTVVSSPSQGAAAQRSSRTSGTAPAGTQVPSGENVTISARARQLAEQSAAADTEKVTRLRSAVENGSLSIDKNAIANRIVDGDDSR